MKGLQQHIRALQELLEQLTFAEECGKLIMPPCWKTGDHCTGKLVSCPLLEFSLALRNCRYMHLSNAEQNHQPQTRFLLHC